MIVKRSAKLLIGIFTAVLSLDILSKWTVDTFLPMMERHLLPYPYGGLAVFQNFFGINFSINHQINTGAAWGIFPNSLHTLFYIRLVIISSLLIYTLFFNQNSKSQIPFVFIITGAVGNVLDTLFYGHVIDFLFVQLWGYDFPVFNIADSFIFMGVVWLCLINLRKENKKTFKNSGSDNDGFNSPSSEN